MSTVKETAKQKLNFDATSNTLTILKTDEEIKAIQEGKKALGSILDLDIDTNEMRSRMNSMSIADRMAAAMALMEESDSNSQVEVDSEIITDIIIIGNKDSIEVSGIKSLNRAINKVSEREAQYYGVKISTELITNDEVSELELADPVYSSDIPLVEHRHKVEIDENMISSRKVSPFRMEQTILLPTDEGYFDIKDLDGFNKILNDFNSLKGQMKSKADEELLKRGVAAEVILKNATVAANKGALKNYIDSQLDEDMDIAQKRAAVGNAMTTLSTQLGNKPLSKTTLRVTLSVMKFHYSPDPNAFSSTSRRVSLFRSDTGALKVERTQYGGQFKVPFMDELEDNFKKLLSSFEKNVLIWGENEVRLHLDYGLSKDEKVDIPNFRTNLKVQDKLQVDPSKKNEINQEVKDAVADIVARMEYKSLKD